MPNSRTSFRSDDANNGNVGHVFVKPEIDLTKPPHMRSDQPSQAEREAWLAGTPRYVPDPQGT